MNQVNKRYLLSRRAWITLVVAAGALIIFIEFIYPFLSVTRRVDANILVVEGWIPDYMLPSAAKEFQQGRYSVLLVSGLQGDPAADQAGNPHEATRNAARLAELGVPRAALVSCPAPFARWLRTSKTARAVRDKVIELAIAPRGINIITAGPHARETWVAYQHIFGAEMPVGIISIPRSEYAPGRWWMSRQGWYFVAKDLVSWLKEIALGLRA
jgi:hypothetical protein